MSKLLHQIGKLLGGLETRAVLGRGSGHLAVSAYDRLGEFLLQFVKEGMEGRSLLEGACVLRFAIVVEPALVADADATTIEGAAVGTHLCETTVLGHSTVTADVVMVAHVDESPGKVVRTQLLGGVILRLACCTAMDDEIVHGISPHLHAGLDVCKEVVLVGDFVSADGQWETFCCHVWNCLVNT